MIGNDIIDLNITATENNWERPGFLEKQFTLKEQQEINISENSFLKVWQFWSMKESAYKCYTQKFEKRFFSPQKFECSLTTNELGVVTFQNKNFYTDTHFSSFYIHTVAEDTLFENSNEIRMYIGIGHPNRVDKNIKERLQKILNISSLEIEKRKTKVGAPQFYHQNTLLTKSCSISHHGNYGAFAFSLLK